MSEAIFSTPSPNVEHLNLGAFDVVIVGAGMAGASLAFELTPDLRVLLLEAESQPGYHSTGRSAALFSEVYGNDAVRALSRASRAFFDSPGGGFSDHPLLTPRGTLFFAAADHLEQLHAMHAEVVPRAPKMRWMEGNALLTQVSALRPEAAQAGLFEPDACDIDVHALHQGYLRGARQRGATVVCSARLESAQHSNSRWTLQTTAGHCSANLLVNAAGAWADDLAALCGVESIGLTPLRRTAIVFDDHQTWNCQHWPLAVEIGEQIYFKPDAGRILASLADETLSAACDAQPDEFDVAVLLDRLERLTLLSPKRITGRWAGLRTFTSDRTPVAGFDARIPNFFWLVGQGGYGIQTAPALAQMSACLIQGQPVPQKLTCHGVRPHDFSAQRLVDTTSASL
jgi:D-arginine dehydrogenase